LLTLLSQKQLIRFLSLLLLFTALASEAATAQSAARVTRGAAAARQPQVPDPASVCSEPSDPRAVNADINLCVDRLVKADVQDVPGVGLDLNVFPYNDPELLSTPQENLFAPRPKVPSFTSWVPQPGSTSWGPRPANVEVLQPEPDEPAPEKMPSPTVQAPGMPLLTDTTATLDELSPGLGPMPDTQWKLKRARARKAAEDKRRQSREQQKRFETHCRQLHLSDLECRLKLKSEPLASITDRMNKLEKLQPKDKH
jgi:hypothetical protein